MGLVAVPVVTSNQSRNNSRQWLNSITFLKTQFESSPYSKKLQK